MSKPEFEPCRDCGAMLPISKFDYERCPERKLGKHRTYPTPTDLGIACVDCGMPATRLSEEASKRTNFHWKTVGQCDKCYGLTFSARNVNATMAMFNRIKR